MDAESENVVSLPTDLALREARAQAWANGQSLGPWLHGLPREECLRIEQRRDEILRERKAFVPGARPE